MAAVDLVNAALRRAGGNRDISAIDDTTPGGAIAGDVYEAECDAALRAHTWNFAVTRVRLGRLSTIPKYEYSYAYRLPTDWLRTIAVYDNEAGSGQADYRQETIPAERLTNGSFDTDSDWTKGSGWAISGGKAVATAGSGSDLSQAQTLGASNVFRVSFLIEGMTAGTLTPKFTGGVTVTGSARSADGYYAEDMTADAGGNTSFVLTKSSAFNGNIDDVSLVNYTGTANPAIISSAEAIWIRYVRQETNTSQMDSLFRLVLILRMAKIFGIALASSSTFHQLLDQELDRIIRLAKSTDAIEDQSERWPIGSWASARWGGRDTWDSWR